MKKQRKLYNMLGVDIRRMFISRLTYIMLAIALVCPVLILVMTTMMDGTVTVNPQTGVETEIQAFDSVWQAISTPSNAPMGMDLTGMCNMNLMYFAAAVWVCLFVSEDFRSGYAKNIFAIRPKKTAYVASKTLVCLLGGTLLILCWLVGSLVGGAVAGLPFDTMGASIFNIVMCIVSKVALMAVFVPIALIISLGAKHKAWLSICCSLGGGMLLFMMIPMLTPLDAGVMNAVLCLAGGAMFSFGLGEFGKMILNKTALV